MKCSGKCSGKCFGKCSGQLGSSKECSRGCSGESASVLALTWPGQPQKPCLTKSFSADRKRGQRKGATSKNVKNRQKVSKIFSTLFDIFSRRAKNVKNRQKVSNIFSTFFDKFRAAPVFQPFLGASALLNRWNPSQNG